MNAKYFFICILTYTCTFAIQKTDTLFVLQDAGETQALLPVIELYEKNHEDYLILAAGVATEQLPHTLSYASLGVSENITKTWPRGQKISSESLEKITEAIEAATIITGVAFELQGQLLEAFAHKGSRTFAYWDNINPEGSDPYFQTAQKVARLARTVLAPRKGFPFPNAQIAGQPTFEQWKAKLQQIDPTAVKAKLPYLCRGKTLVFIGGYGKAFEEAFDAFLLVAEKLPEVDILISCHPKTGGAYEREKITHLPHVHLLTEISTMKAVAISDAVICHQSTVGVQAAAAGKPVYYLIPPSQSYTNPALEKGLAFYLTSPEDLQKTPPAKDFFRELNMPENSAQIIYDLLHGS